MLIKENVLKHWIDNFYGYGSWDARFWFVGYEEGGGELPEEVADKINYLYKTHTPSTDSIPELQPPTSEPSLCNIRELYKHVALRSDGPKANSYSTLYEYRFDEHAVQHGSWKNLIAFTHGYKHERVPDLFTYQRKTFLSPTTPHEALIQLYPLPSPHNHAWYYSWLDLPTLGFIRNRTQYQEQVYPFRINTILTNISRHKPEIVLMYGMDNINKLKHSIQQFFDDVKFKMVKATKRLTPQHHRADINGTTILITTQIPTLRHNRIETGFDWEEFGKRVRAGVDN